jgi:ubiquinone/menaquinone biosynthesis C-methylase UbiE
MSPGELRFRLRCIDKLGVTFRGDESLLDVGCGDGGVARLLSERVGEVVAVDIAESDAWRDAPGIRFQVADAEHLPFDDGVFDLVHSKDALHHMTDPARALAEYNRVLQPHGTALVVEANRHNPSLFLQMTLIRRHDHFTDERFRELVTAAFPRAAFGAFEAHYVPGATRVLPLQNAVEDALEKIPSLRSVLAYNFAVANAQTG